MKSFVDNILSKLQLSASQCEKGEYQQGLLDAKQAIEKIEKEAKLEEAVRVVIKHLNENPDKYHPHMKLIIDSTSFELVEGIQSVDKIYDYLKD